MIFISHRGNINGKNPSKENSPLQISYAISNGYDVEVDLRGHDGKIFLGHDEPQYKVNESLIDEFKPFLWVHCKDKYALDYAMERELNFFFHTKDDYTLTYKGYIWAYPGIEEAGKYTIAVLPELYFDISTLNKRTFNGYCSDVIEKVKKEFYV